MGGNVQIQKKLKETNKKKKKTKMTNTKNGYWTSGKMDFGLKSPNLGFLVPAAVSLRRREGQQMVSTCVVPTVKYGGDGVMV